MKKEKSFYRSLLLSLEILQFIIFVVHQGYQYFWASDSGDNGNQLYIF